MGANSGRIFDVVLWDSIALEAVAATFFSGGFKGLSVYGLGGLDAVMITSFRAGAKSGDSQPDCTCFLQFQKPPP